MTAKRYFKREWEEEYYIFDSETISEKEFDEKVEYEDYQSFVDSMQGDEVVDRLNALHEENTKVLSLIDKKIDDLQKKYDFGQNVYQGCPMHNIMHSINVLKEIKKEIGWE